MNLLHYVKLRGFLGFSASRAEENQGCRSTPVTRFSAVYSAISGSAGISVSFVKGSRYEFFVSVKGTCLSVEVEPYVFMQYFLESMVTCSPHLILMLLFYW